MDWLLNYLLNVEIMIYDLFKPFAGIYHFCLLKFSLPTKSIR